MLLLQAEGVIPPVYLVRRCVSNVLNTYSSSSQLLLLLVTAGSDTSGDDVLYRVCPHSSASPPPTLGSPFVPRLCPLRGSLHQICGDTLNRAGCSLGLPESICGHNMYLTSSLLTLIYMWPLPSFMPFKCFPGSYSLMTIFANALNRETVT